MAKKRAFVKYTKKGKIIPGSLIVTTNGGYPVDGLYKEVSVDLCCNDTNPCTPADYGDWKLVTGDGVVLVDNTDPGDCPAFTFIGPNDSENDGWVYLSKYYSSTTCLEIDYEWTSFDDSDPNNPPNVDWPVYWTSSTQPTGIPGDITPQVGSTPDDGTWNVTVPGGQWFSIGIYSDDSCCGRGFLSVEICELLCVTRKFWGLDIISAGRSMVVPNQTAFYTGNTVANITATNPDLRMTGVFSGQALSSQGRNWSRTIAPTSSSPFVTVTPTYTFNDGSGLPILRSVRDYYDYLTKIINNSFLATRNPEIVIKRVSYSFSSESGLLQADNFFLIGINFDSTGLERDGYTLTYKNYDFDSIPGTINVSAFTYTTAFTTGSGSGSNFAMSTVAPSSTWVNNSTFIYGVTIREDFPIPPGW